MKKLTVCLLLILFQLSCAGDFHMQKDRAGGRTMVLVPGTPFPSTMAMIRLLSRELEKNPHIQIIPLPQSEGPYPTWIRGPYRPSLMEIDVDDGLTDIDAIEKIQGQTGADLVFVLWTPVENRSEIVPRRGHTLLEECVTVETLHGAARMFRFPGAALTGRGDFTVDFTDADTVPCRGLAENLPPIRMKAMRKWARETAKEISRGITR